MAKYSASTKKNPCPACGREISINDMNIDEGIGLCRGCGKLSPLSDIVSDSDTGHSRHGGHGEDGVVSLDGPNTRSPDVIREGFDEPGNQPGAASAGDPPSGCRVSGGLDETLVYASLRSVGTFLGGLFMCVFWNGIVSVFVLIAASGLYRHFVGPLPQWFPAPDFDDDMPLGMLLFLCLFLTPFVLIGTFLFVSVLLGAFGRIQVRIGRDRCLVRTGFGPFNWTRKFDPAAVRRVRIGQTSWQQNNRHKPLIEIETKNKTVKFGTLLTDQRRHWLHAILSELLAGDRDRQ